MGSLFPRTLNLEDDNTVTRTQYALVLAWALTPWKAQGMSLKKVEVKIGSAASRPGVAFTTLTRCTHPDGLAINDDFRVMSTFQKQKKQKNDPASPGVGTSCSRDVFQYHSTPHA